MRLSRPLRLLLATLASGSLLGSLPPPRGSEPRGEAGEPHRLVREGVEVVFSMEPLDPQTSRTPREGEKVAFRFAISYTATGEPLAGAYPAAWMSLLGAGPAPGPEQCKQRVEELVGGSLFSRAELDLNVYYVLAMNDDPSISVVDPLFGFGGTKLLALIPLPSPGEDWTLSADRERLFVSLPDSGQVAVVTTADWRLESLIDVGERPMMVELQADGVYLWVTLEGGGESPSGVAVVDARERRLEKVLATGAGPHEIALSDDSRYAFVTNRDAGTVTVIDAAERRQVRDLATGDRPVSVAWSRLAQAAYVSHAGDGTVVAIDGHRHEIVARMRARPGLGQIRFSLDGRLGFVVNPEKDAINVLDAAANRIVQTGEMGHGPDQLAVSENLVFVRHRDSEIVLMLPLAEVGKADRPVHAADFPGGQASFGQGVRPSMADTIVQAPGAAAVLVANPADRMIYYYKEGMAAPMGGFSNYQRQPRAVLVVDRSLRARRSPGVYETAAILRRPGRYQVAFFLDTPRIVHCFDVEVEPDPVLEARRQAELPARVEALEEMHQSVTAGSEVSLRFRLTDPRTGAPDDGLRDVRVMAFSTAGWQWRQWAAGVGDGVYEVSFTPPSPGIYFVQVECLSQRLEFHQSPRVTLRAVAASPREEQGSPTP